MTKKITYQPKAEAQAEIAQDPVLRRPQAKRRNTGYRRAPGVHGIAPVMGWGQAQRYPGLYRLPLTARQREVLERRYTKTGLIKRTYDQISRDMGISLVMACVHCQKAHARLARTWLDLMERPPLDVSPERYQDLETFAYIFRDTMGPILAHAFDPQETPSQEGDVQYEIQGVALRPKDPNSRTRIQRTRGPKDRDGQDRRHRGYPDSQGDAPKA
jgi:hypothetical protein